MKAKEEAQGRLTARCRSRSSAPRAVLPRPPLFPAPDSRFGGRYLLRGVGADRRLRGRGPADERKRRLRPQAVVVVLPAASASSSEEDAAPRPVRGGAAAAATAAREAAGAASASSPIPATPPATATATATAAAAAVASSLDEAFATPASALPPPSFGASPSSSFRGRNEDQDEFFDAADEAAGASPTGSTRGLRFAGDEEEEATLPAWTLEFSADPPSSPSSLPRTTPPVRLSMRLADVEFWWRRPTIAALATVGVDLGQAMSSKGGAVGGVAVVGRGVSDDDESDGDEGGSSSSFAAPAPSTSSSPSSPSFELSVSVSALRITFLYEDEETAPPLGRAAVETLSLTLTAGGGSSSSSSSSPSSGLTLVATLGNLTADDGSLPEGHPYKQAVGLRPGASGSLVTLFIASRGAGDVAATAATRGYGDKKPCLPRVPEGAPAFWEVRAKLCALRVVYLNRLLQEALRYVFLTFRLQPPPLQPQPQLPLSSASSSAPAAPPDTRPPVIVMLDVDADAPVITMPRRTDSGDAIEVDLGRLALRSEVAWAEVDDVGGSSSTSSPSQSRGDERKRHRILLETTTIVGSRLGGCGVVAGTRGRDVVTGYDRGIKITLRRPLVLDAAAAAPKISVDVDLPSLAASLSDAEYALVTTVAAENVAEALRLGGEAGAWMERTYPEPAVSVAWQGVGGGISSSLALASAASSSSPSAEPAPISTRVSVRVGFAELRLTHAVAGGGSEQLAAVAATAGVCVSYTSDALGGAKASVLLPALSATDERPGVPRGRAAALSARPPPALTLSGNGRRSGSGAGGVEIIGGEEEDQDISSSSLPFPSAPDEPFALLARRRLVPRPARKGASRSQTPRSQAVG